MLTKEDGKRMDPLTAWTHISPYRECECPACHAKIYFDDEDDWEGCDDKRSSFRECVVYAECPACGADLELYVTLDVSDVEAHLEGSAR